MQAAAAVKARLEQEVVVADTQHPLLMVASWHLLQAARIFPAGDMQLEQVEAAVDLLSQAAHDAQAIGAASRSATYTVSVLLLQHYVHAPGHVPSGCCTGARLLLSVFITLTPLS